MKEVKHDQNSQLKETNKGQIQKTASNQQNGDCEELRPVCAADLVNLAKSPDPCNKQMRSNSREMLKCGDGSEDSHLSRKVDEKKSEIIPTQSSNLSQGMVGVNPIVSKNEVNTINNLDKTEPSISSDTQHFSPPHNIKMFNITNDQETKNLARVSESKTTTAVVGASVQFSSSHVEGKKPPLRYDTMSAPFLSSSKSPTMTKHGFKYAVDTRKPQPSEQQTISLPQSSHFSANTSNKKRKDIITTGSCSTVRNRTSMTEMHYAPLRPRSNSVPNYRNKEEVSSESSSGALRSLQCVVSGISSFSRPKSKAGSLRRGKWTAEEEAYVARVIKDFNSGYLDAPAGTTLRTFLSDKLNCDPMRITKKFTGDACIGKRVFHPAIRCTMNATIIDKAQNELKCLERQWRRRIEIQRQESEKKQAASSAAAAAAAAAAASGRLNLNGHKATRSIGETLHQHSISTSRNDVAQTASWLDRANAILSHTQDQEKQYTMKTSNGDSVEKEMEEVQRLIYEGPIIQKTSAGFTTLFETGSNDLPPPASVLETCNNPASKQEVSEDQYVKSSTEKVRLHDQPTNAEFSSALICSENASSSVSHGISGAAPASKRIRKSYSTSNLESVTPSGNELTGAVEDAATLMGFLSSVRQIAASRGTSLK